ncbi:MAG: NAD(P)-binding protein, partial [Myxococcales bacterium]|nr:NAD(P)-binding protein [Myxococcales bacterium]
MEQPIAVIGAGIAGLAAAEALRDAGRSVEVFDKARGPGGRMATRRDESDAFDHGAQYFTAREPAFAAQVEAWTQAGVVAEWTGRFGRLAGRFIAEKPARPRYVGTPRMSALTRH